MIPVIPPRTGVAFQLKRCERWKVIDPAGQQSRDLVAFNHEEPRESIFSGRSIDYGSKLFFGLGDRIYSNRSSALLEIVEDTAGRHDFRLSPCSAELFRIIFGDETPHRGCFGNLAAPLAPYGIDPDAVPTAVNGFLNVRVDGDSGVISVQPPLSGARDFTVFEARMDLLIGLTACSAAQSNNFACKPIHYEVMHGE